MDIDTTDGQHWKGCLLALLSTWQFINRHSYCPFESAQFHSQIYFSK